MEVATPLTVEDAFEVVVEDFVLEEVVLVAFVVDAAVDVAETEDVLVVTVELAPLAAPDRHCE